VAWAYYIAGISGGLSRGLAQAKALAARVQASAPRARAALQRYVAHLGRDRKLTYVLTGLLFLSLVGSGWGIMSNTWRKILEAQARSTAMTFAGHLSEEVPDLAAIASGKAVSAASASALQHVQSDHGVLSARVFDAAGELRLQTIPTAKFGAGLPAVIEQPTDRIEVRRVLLPGQPEGAYWVSATVPINDGGRLAGALDITVDMTMSYNSIYAVLVKATLSFGLILAVAFGVPGLGFWLRTQQKERAESQLDFLTQHDALTSLPNRSSLMRRLTRLLPGEGGEPKGLAVLSLGLDRFKEINTSLGHEAGDAMLRDIADRISGALKPGEFVARAGGDEFVVVKECTNGNECARELAQRLLKAFSRPYAVREQTMRVDPSIGIAMSPEDGIDPETLLRNGNLALQAAKTEARGSFTFFHGAMDDQSQRRRAVAHQVRVACEQDAFQLHYQPVYSFSTGMLAGFEALVRLPQPDGSMVPPCDFIPAAEDLGLITKIGTFVLETACQTAAAWPDDLSIAVNVSPTEFRDGRVVERVAAALAKSGLKPERLEIEVTEGVFLADTETTRRTFEGLKKLGVAIVLDDFGTGYSSLSYLWQFRFDKLKIDQSFVRAIGKGNNVTDIIRTIVALGRALDLRVTAEGVETEAQAAVLKAMRCDLVQGYLYGRPAAQPDVPAYVARPLPGSLAAARA
jgi:diguanylate cyclase (GGDEF)-like protein